MIQLQLVFRNKNGLCRSADIIVRSKPDIEALYPPNLAYLLEFVSNFSFGFRILQV